MFDDLPLEPRVVTIFFLLLGYRDLGSNQMESPTKVFNRTVESADPILKSINRALDSDIDVSRALARNIEFDGRVFPSREKLLRDFCNENGSDLDFLGAQLVIYYQKRIRSSQCPDFQRPENRENIVIGGTESIARFPTSTKLARVLDLSGLEDFFSRLFDTDDQFESTDFYRRIMRPYYGDAPTESATDSWSHMLDYWLEQDPHDFLQGLVEVQNAYRHLLPWHPVWVTFWGRFTDLIDNPWKPELALASLGIAKQTAQRWVIAMRYTADRVGTLARPSQLESGRSGIHFPTPSDADPVCGGHPMHLGEEIDVHEDLYPEFIHDEIDWRIDDFMFDDLFNEEKLLLAQTAQPVHPTSIGNTRRRHRNRLEIDYESLGEWMRIVD